MLFADNYVINHRNPRSTLLGPRVCGDGLHVVVESSRAGNTGHVWKMNMDGSNQAQLTNNPMGWLRKGGDCSLDGKWVFYLRKEPDSGIFKVSIDGGEPVQLNMQ